ncbi:MAG: ribbon-helix-helix protein, CopG family [Thaumarchaeota archaeon]|nr:ribbon-helix-helix protein, CopG family [Nitrososphaerota archaeon]MCL5317371.1 ribbon-helix-helix protein, CopG family [Nitrososphaerota archaeon]
MERALVSLPDNVMAIVDSLKGTLGEGRSDIIRAIVISYLSEKGYLRGDKKDEQKQQ